MRVLVAFTTKRSFNPLSWLIRKMSRSEVSHVAIIFTQRYTDLVLQANHLRTNIQELSTFQKEENIVATMMAEVDEDKFYAFVLPLLGTKYGMLTLIGMGLQRIGNLLGIKSRVLFRDKYATFVCSELIISVLQESGKHEQVRELDSERDGPQELFVALSKKGRNI